MKFFTASILVGFLASMVATDNVSDIGDYFYGLDATDVAPYSCTSASEFFSCYRPVSAYEGCGNQDDSDSCYCSSALIDENCHTKYCPNLTFNTYDISRYCKASATPVSSPAKTTSAPSTTTTTNSSSAGKSSSSSSSSAAAASASSSAKPAALATDSSAQATSTPSSTTAAGSSSSSIPNAGGRSVVVSLGGVVVAVVAVAVAGAGAGAFA